MTTIAVAEPRFSSRLDPIVNHLMERRDELGLTTADIALRAGVSPRQLRRLFTGETTLDQAGHGFLGAVLIAVGTALGEARDALADVTEAGR